LLRYLVQNIYVFVITLETDVTDDGQGLTECSRETSIQKTDEAKDERDALTSVNETRPVAAAADNDTHIKDEGVDDADHREEMSRLTVNSEGSSDEDETVDDRTDVKANEDLSDDDDDEVCTVLCTMTC